MKWAPYVILPLCAGAWAWAAFYGLDLMVSGAKVLGSLVWCFLGLVMVGFSVAGGGR